MPNRVKTCLIVWFLFILLSGCEAFHPLGTSFPATSTRIALTATEIPFPTVSPVTERPLGEMGPTAIDSSFAPPAAQRGGMIAFYSDRDGNPEIYVMTADGGHLQRLTNNSASDQCPAVSPDGTRIAFVSDRDGNREIYLMNVDGSELQRLTDSPAYESHPAWSPDGTQIAFISERDGNREIYIMNADGSNVLRLTDDPADDLRPNWSPDGTQIVFNSDRYEDFDIFVVNIDGSNLRRLTDNQKWEMFPQWSPDGTRIAYTLLTPRQWDQEIYVMDADGSARRQLTDSAAASENPIWSPDGSQIIFQSDRDGDFEIYVMDVDGNEGGSGDLLPLTDHPAGDFWPSWGPAIENNSTEIPEQTQPVVNENAEQDNAILHTHVCGFLVITSGKRILIDSLFQVPSPPTPAERLRMMREGLPPFDDLDLILITHDHLDHFDAGLVGNNMINNPEAVLVSTDVVVNKLRSQFPQYEQIRDRVIGVDLKAGEREQINIAGIDLDVLFLSHGVSTIPNLGFLFTVGDTVLFHTGDMNPENIAVSDLQAYDLPERQIDIAFVSGFRLADERYADHILDGIQPKIMVPMHFNFAKEYDISVLDEVEANFQNVILFHEEMTWETFDLGMFE